MKFFAVALAAFATGVLAAPTNGGSFDPCPKGLFSVPECCATDILGLADLDCHSRELSLARKAVFYMMYSVTNKLPSHREPS